MHGKTKTKFVIFGQGRSGSTLLKQLLDSHPEIKCEGELLNIKDGYLPNELMLKLVYRIPFPFFNYRKWIAKYPVYGFTLLFYQYWPQNYMLNKLVRNGWKIIYLTRNDSFSQSLSHLVAKQTSVWHRRNDDQEKETKVRINPEEFLNWIKQLQKNKSTENEIIKSLNHFEVVYENDMIREDMWSKTTARIFEYLGVYPAPAMANLKKTYSRPYSEIVENYEDLLLLTRQNNIPVGL